MFFGLAQTLADVELLLLLQLHAPARRQAHGVRAAARHRRRRVALELSGGVKRGHARA